MITLTFKDIEEFWRFVRKPGDFALKDLRIGSLPKPVKKRKARKTKPSS